MDTLTAVIHSTIFLNNFVACAVLFTATGAGLIFIGSIEKTQFRHVFPGLHQFLLGCTMSSFAFAFIVGIGYRRGLYDSVLGAVLGFSLGAAYWFHAAITSLFWNANHESRRLSHRVLVGCLFVFVYGLAILIIAFYHYTDMIFVVAIAALPGLALRIVMFLFPLLRMVLRWFYSFIVAITPYIAGAALTFSGKEFILHAFTPGVPFERAALILFLFGWYGCSFYLITLRIIRWEQSPTELEIGIGALKFMAKITRWLPIAHRWLEHLINKCDTRLKETIDRQKHQAYLRFSSLMGGLATGLGYGAFLILSGGPALGLEKRIVFGIETFMIPIVIGLIENRIERGLRPQGVIIMGLTVLIAGTSMALIVFGAFLLGAIPA